jgi:Glyoxalase-like domain
MTLKAFTVVIDCTDPRRQADFWAEVLSCDVRERNPDEYLVSDPAGKAFPLYFMKVPEPKVGKNRFHLDLVTDGSMSEEVDRLVKLGARVIDVRQDDAETYDNPDTWTVLEDLEGNVFCVTSSTTLSGWT